MLSRCPLRVFERHLGDKGVIDKRGIHFLGAALPYQDGRIVLAEVPAVICVQDAFARIWT